MSDNIQRILVPTSAKARISRRLLLSGAVGIGSVATLAACASGGGGSSKGGSINLYTWGEYDDPAVLKSYTAKTGTKIALDSYDSNEQMIAKLAAAKGTSGYDIVVPTDRYIPQMVEADLLEELDHSKLPNIKNILPPYNAPGWDKELKHSVVKAIGVSGYVYDTTVVKREMKTWVDFWDVAANEAKGKTSLLADPGEVCGMYYLQKGIDVNSTSKADLEACKAFLLSKANLIQAFESYVSNTVAQNGRVLMHAWNGDARRGMLDNKDQDRYKFVLPTEGSLRFVDNWSIVKGSDAMEQSYAFINWVLDPAVSFKEAEYVGYGTGIKGVQEKAEAAKLELLDLMFFTEEQEAKFRESEITSATEVQTTIYSALTAAAG